MEKSILNDVYPEFEIPYPEFDSQNYLKWGEVFEKVKLAEGLAAQR